ncbi:MAG TPA: S9 family peptidase [Candidatus Synoicihabitans sp.]|nr:S9 family peptidase [Candidatus Synoicihabitans sp.]
MAWLAVVPLHAIDRLPIEDFARTPIASRMALAPDAAHVAFLRDIGGRTLMHVAEVESGKLSYLEVGEALLANDARKEVESFQWINADRLLLGTTALDAFYGVIAVNRDGSAAVPISGYEDNRVVLQGKKLWAREVIFNFRDAEGSLLMLDRHEGGSGSWNRPDILKVNTKTGLTKTVVKNPGTVGYWGLDAAGVARLGILTHGDLSGAIYRENERAEWRTILPLQDRSGQLRPMGFDPATETMFVAALTPEKRWAVYRLDPSAGTLGEPLLSDPQYDILPQRAREFGGHALVAPILSPERDQVLGVRYLTETTRVKWFDPQFARHQGAIDRALPETVNILVGLSDDRRRMLWYSFSDRHPGVYTLADVEKRSLRQLATCRPWLKPEQLAQTLAIKYAARDGLMIHGFLTVPAGYEPKNLPLVVLPHGGPWVRDVWGFDPLVQLLANRGYAVLQMNYRGSPGYGEELYRAARREIGGKIQDDIEDGTRWAIAAGIADPKRIAIMGSSYGGYSTLFALGRSAELYRCGISINGVTDWPAIYDARKSDSAYRSANRHWRREIGDREKDAALLHAISPVNFADKIVAPVLILQGKEDRIVPVEQARLMIRALERAGRQPESLIISKLGHSYGDERQRLQIYTKVVEFLEEHLGAGVP